MTEQDYILIETYLQGELPAAETEAFERRLGAEPKLAAALAERRELNAYLRATAREGDLRANLRALGAQYFNDDRGADAGAMGRAASPPVSEAKQGAKVISINRRRNRLRFFGIAAAILLLAILALPFIFGGGPEYTDFNDHQPLALVVRGDTDAIAGEAQTAYNAGNYPVAVDLLRQYLQSPDANQQARLALGISLLETDHDAEAVHVFTEVADGTDNLAGYGKYYLALAAVKAGDEAGAAAILSALETTDDFLAAKVQRLRASL